MRRIVETFRRPPTGRIRDRNGGLPRLSDGVTHASRCPASPQRTLLAESLGKPSLWVMISDPWYYRRDRPGRLARSGRNTGSGISEREPMGRPSSVDRLGARMPGRACGTTRSATKTQDF
ncbi:MAG: hypothetical protein IID50_12475 [Proteobacteria bacterium]|nr:hypothetical protein [Pseudomonadota bacterium]